MQKNHKMKRLILKFISPLRSRCRHLAIKFSIFITKQKVNEKNEFSYLRMLELNGYVKIQDPKFLDYSKIIEEKYFSNDEDIFNKNNKHILQKLTTTANRIGNYSCRVSFKDSYIAEILMDQKIIKILNGYLGKCYYRESPLIEYYAFQNPAEATRDIIPYAVSFHADYYRQLNIMLLLSDIDEHDTCTEYAVGSHHRNVFIQGSNIGYPLANHIIDKNKYKIEKITGKKGDVIIMDTTGIHRVSVQSGSIRKLLVGVLNCDYPFLGYSEKLSQADFSYEKNKINSSLIKIK